MGRASVQLIVPREFRAWERGFGRLPEEAAELAEVHWHLAAELFFNATQEVVHVVSGDLKRSGRIEDNSTGVSVIADIVYGGVMGSKGFVDYADIEMNRGGAHDFMARGWAIAEREFDAVLPLVWREVVAGWR